jgi:hypothetical protein
LGTPEMSLSENDVYPSNGHLKGTRMTNHQIFGWPVFRLTQMVPKGKIIKDLKETSRFVGKLDGFLMSFL